MSNIEAGRHLARCTGPGDVQFVKAKSGNEQIAIQFRLTEDGPNKGARVTYFGSFSSEKSIDFTLKALRTCGWESDDLNDLAGVDANEVELVIAYEDDDQGNPRLKVKFVNEAGGGGIQLKNAMGENDRRAFAAKMRGAVIAHRQTSAPAKKSAPAKRATSNGSPGWDGQGPEPSDEIPF